MIAHDLNDKQFQAQAKLFKLSYDKLRNNEVLPSNTVATKLAKYSMEFHYIRVDVVRALSNLSVNIDKGDKTKIKKHYKKLKNGHKQLKSIIKRMEYENSSSSTGRDRQG